MDRAKIKAEAKQKIKGHLWDIWKPYLVYLFISLIISIVIQLIFGPTTSVKYNEHAKTLSDLMESMKFETNYFATFAQELFNFLLIPMQIGMAGYMLNFVRGKKYNLDSLKEFYPKIGNILIMTILMSLFMSIGFVLCIIPGIIIALMYAMVNYIFADDPEQGPFEYLKKSKAMMDGYKGDFFVFEFSFIGWWLACILIFPIIWVYPYVSAANALYYEELKKVKK